MRHSTSKIASFHGYDGGPRCATWLGTMLRASSGIAILGGLLLACTHQETSGASTESDLADDADHSLDAVGAIVADHASGSSSFCTGTLITPRLVLTSKRCMLRRTITSSADGRSSSMTQEYLFEQSPLRFVVGGTTSTPSRSVMIDEAIQCDPDKGGVDGMGCNVGLYRLAEPISGVAPLLYAKQPLPTVGTRFTVSTFTGGTRQVGALTLRAVTGAPMAALFPTLEDFTAAWSASQGDASAQERAPWLSRYYAKTLLDDHEAWLGAAEGDVQLCDGHQGAPLLAKNAEGKLTVFGVAGNGMQVETTACTPFGTAFGVLGASEQAMIAKNLVDACGDETTTGRCDGDTVVRCTRRDEGPRRVTRNECGNVLGKCIPASDRVEQAFCGDEP